MEIKDFSELTDFLGSEVSKIMEVFTIENPKNLVKFYEKELFKYVKLYSEPLYESEKLKIKINRAIETMPHGKLWRFFHKNLWNIIQEQLKQNLQKEEPQIEEQPETVSCLPVIINQAQSPIIMEEDE